LGGGFLGLHESTEKNDPRKVLLRRPASRDLERKKATIERGAIFEDLLLRNRRCPEKSDPIILAAAEGKIVLEGVLKSVPSLEKNGATWARGKN